MIFRRNNNWLRHRVKSQIRKRHTDLFDPIHKSVWKNLLSFISESKNGWFVFLSVLLIFILSPFINFSILNFLNIESATAVYIVDQRTANIATNENWYDNELTVDVFPVEEEEAQRKLDENRAKWTTTEDGEVLSDDEALLLIKTSIIIDIWTTIEFIVLNRAW